MDGIRQKKLIRGNKTVYYNFVIGSDLYMDSIDEIVKKPEDYSVNVD
jgi:hypothetical protein